MCHGRESNPYGHCCPRDFKSRMSTSSITMALTKPDSLTNQGLPGLSKTRIISRLYGFRFPSLKWEMNYPMKLSRRSMNCLLRASTSVMTLISSWSLATCASLFTFSVVISFASSFAFVFAVWKIDWMSLNCSPNDLFVLNVAIDL